MKEFRAGYEELVEQMERGELKLAAKIGINNLRILPLNHEDQWTQTMEKERLCYQELKSRFVFDPSKFDNNLDVNNPLSLEENNIWKQSFEDVELKNVIMQDVQRTFPDNIIFESEHVQNLLLNVLFVWAKLNPNISYRQGMHELAAMIFMVVNEDSYPKDAPSMDVISELFDERHIEADTSILFFNLMKDVKPWYEVNHITSRPPTDTIPIIASCNRIYEYLKALDPELFNHIHDVNEIEPQLFGLRWLRLLFSREFTIDQAFQIWDSLFSEDNCALSAEWFSVAMLYRIRTEVLDSDYSNTMQFLMKFPSIDSVSKLVLESVKLKQKYAEIQSKNIQVKIPVDIPPTKTQLQQIESCLDSAIGQIEKLELDDKYWNLKIKLRSVRESLIKGKGLITKPEGSPSTIANSFRNINLKTSELVSHQINVLSNTVNNAFGGFGKGQELEYTLDNIK